MNKYWHPVSPLFQICPVLLIVEIFSLILEFNFAPFNPSSFTARSSSLAAASGSWEPEKQTRRIFRVFIDYSVKLVIRLPGNNGALRGGACSTPAARESICISIPVSSIIFNLPSPTSALLDISSLFIILNHQEAEVPLNFVTFSSSTNSSLG